MPHTSGPLPAGLHGISAPTDLPGFHHRDTPLQGVRADHPGPNTRRHTPVQRCGPLALSRLGRIAELIADGIDLIDIGRPARFAAGYATQPGRACRRQPRMATCV